MSEKMGVENLKEVIDLVLDGVDLGKAVLADGKVGADDLDDVFLALPKIAKDAVAAGTDISMVVPEAKDLSAEEVSALGAHVVARLAVADEHAKAIVEASLLVAGSLLKLVKVITG